MGSRDSKAWQIGVEILEISNHDLKVIVEGGNEDSTRQTLPCRSPLSRTRPFASAFGPNAAAHVALECPSPVVLVDLVPKEKPALALRDAAAGPFTASLGCARMFSSVM